MFGFFSTREVLAFAAEIVGEYDRLRRSTAMRHDSPAKRKQKFEKLTEKIEAYTRSNKLNFYKKSKMLFAIKQGLGEKGVAEEDIDALLNTLLVNGLAK